MRHNVYMRSTFRQPVRAGLLVCLLAFICLAFTSRTAEALYIWQETGRIERSYNIIGYLEPLSDEDAEPAAAAAVLEKSELVKLADWPRQVSGVLQGEYNADWSSRRTYQYQHSDIFVCARFQGARQTAWGGYEFYFAVDTVQAGYPEYVEAGDVITLASSRTNEADAAGAADAFEQLVRGERYLIRGRYARDDPSCTVAEYFGIGSQYYSIDAFIFEPLDGEALWLYPLEADAAADLSAPELRKVKDEISLIDSNQRALLLLAMQDVSLHYITQEGADYYLTDGRWPDGEDDAAKAKVCAIHVGLATARGLSVGDTITLSMRNVEAENRTAGYLYGEEAQAENLRQTAAERYEIVGIYNDVLDVQVSDLWDQVFIPYSALPNAGAPGEEQLQNGLCSFVLSSPRKIQEFQETAGAQLAKAGYRAVLLETNWASFYSTEKSMRNSAFWNIVFYTVVLLGTMGLVVFLYLSFRKKELVIARALGVPAQQCVRQFAGPLLVLGAAGILAGSAIGWDRALAQAAETLQALREFGGNTELSRLPAAYLAALCGMLWLMLALLVLGTATFFVKRSVLVLLQNGHTRGIRFSAAAAQAAPAETAPRPERSARPACGRDGAAKPDRAVERPLLTFVWRHIARAKIRSALTALLAAAFVFSLASIRFSIVSNQKKLDSLCKNTAVTLQLVQANTDAAPYALGGGFISQQLVDDLYDTGYIAESELEGAATGSVLQYDQAWTEGQRVSFQGNSTAVVIRSFADEESLLRGTGKDISISYADGWDKSLFETGGPSGPEAGAKAGAGEVPLILPRTLLEHLDLAAGDTLGLVCKTKFCLGRIAGVYDGPISGIERYDIAVLMPNAALQKLVGDSMMYISAQFTLDPARNLEIDGFRSKLDQLMQEEQAALFTIGAVLEDGELRQTIDPVRSNIQLMEGLFPVVFVIALLCAAGTSALLMLLSAKEAAVLRVLGTTRRQSLLVLCSQSLLPCFAGIAMGGICGLAAVAAQPGLGRTPFSAVLLGMLLYGAAAAAGAVSSAAAVLHRDPLELLQIRE